MPSLKKAKKRPLPSAQSEWTPPGGDPARVNAHRISAYLQLARARHGWTHAVPIGLAGLASGRGTGFAFMALLLGHTFYHLSCLVNDLADAKADAQDARRARQSPLLGGSVTPHTLLLWCAIHTILLGAALSLLPPQAAFAGVVATSLTLWGNQYQKSGVLPPQVIDVLYALTLFLAASAALLPRTDPLVFATLGSCSLQLIVLNRITGNLKDLRFDRLAGAHTSALAEGVALRRSGYSLTKRYVHRTLLFQVLATGLNILPMVTATTSNKLATGFVLGASLSLFALVGTAFQLVGLENSTRLPAPWPTASAFGATCCNFAGIIGVESVSLTLMASITLSYLLWLPVAASTRRSPDRHA